MKMIDGPFPTTAALNGAAGSFAAVGLSVAVQNGGFGVDTHAAAEIWIPEMGGWIYQDPTFNCFWNIDGKPVSALALHEAVMSGKQIAFSPRDSKVEDGLRSPFTDNSEPPQPNQFHHVSYRRRVPQKPPDTIYFLLPRLPMGHRARADCCGGKWAVELLTKPRETIT